MDFSYSPKVVDLQQRLTAFMDEHIYPAEAVYHAEVEANRRAGNAWQPTRVMEDLKAKARAAGLWNLFLPESQYGAGLTNLEYAPLCEIMGRSHVAPEAFNCSAPDTGNMETLVSQELSEFALHARAILGLPVGAGEDGVIGHNGPSASCAMLAHGHGVPVFSNVEAALRAPDTALRLFAKPRVEGQRRVGVTLARAGDIDAARAIAREAAAAIGIEVQL